MTREEAIEHIVQAKYDINVSKTQEEALDMAIKALEQKSCEDSISRKDIIAKIEDEYEGYMLSEGATPQDFVYMIMDMPSVTPQPKTGHWIEDEDEMKVWCSECGEENDRCSKCCPNCGIKMVKPQEGEG